MGDLFSFLKVASYYLVKLFKMLSCLCLTLSNNGCFQSGKIGSGNFNGILPGIRVVTAITTGSEWFSYNVTMLFIPGTIRGAESVTLVLFWCSMDGP